jgi:hypothetical protein
MEWGMALQIGAGKVHPAGEVLAAHPKTDPAVLAAPLVVDTHGRRFHVEWDPAAPVTPLGQLVFFSQFLATAGLYHDWVKSCPLVFTSNNAPALNDLLGTNTLAILSGQHRYSHVTALRADTVNPAGFGMSKVCSEDSVRRAFAGADPAACALWQTAALRRAWLPALRHPWVMDMDATVKPLYGHQEGAEIGYNPHKPGRPSHAYHSLFVRGLRLVLDVEVHSGKQTAATHGRENLWRIWESLPAECRPWLVCGDSSYGHEGLLAECEARAQKYLFRLRRSTGVKQLVQTLERKGGWKPAVNGWEGLEGQLQLTGWTAKRRVVVLRRKVERTTEKEFPRELGWPMLAQCGPAPEYEYQVLVTNLSEEILSIADLYRQRADAENVYDELKNQWGSRRVHDEGPVALPGGGAKRGVDLQLVEFVCALRGAGAAARSGDEPSAVVVRRGPGGGERAAIHPAPDEHARTRGGRTKAAHRPEPVPERPPEHCGAVEPERVLGADLDADFNSVADPEGGIARSQRVSWEPQDMDQTKSAPDVRLKPAPQAQRVFYCRI